MRFIDFLLRKIQAINRVTLFICKYTTILLVAAITIVVCAGIFWRYFLNNSLAWTEETSKFLMVWMVFTGIPLALKSGAHAAIEALPNALPEKSRQTLYAFIYLFIIVLMTVLIQQGWLFAYNARLQETSTTQVSMMFVFISMPIGGVLMFLVALELFIQAIIGIYQPQQGVHPRDLDTNQVTAE
ncbi:MAG: TRAP transporter small permease [Desulfobacterales bacterium]|nr:TRAP transporter small permease [Desulfobacterales bacterium]